MVVVLPCVALMNNFISDMQISISRVVKGISLHVHYVLPCLTCLYCNKIKNSTFFDRG